MVPLQHLEWAEVKTLAIETVGAPVQERGEWVVHTAQLLYVTIIVEQQSYLGPSNIQNTVIYTATNPARFERLWR